MLPFDDGVRRALTPEGSSTTCSSARSARRTCRWGRTSASATTPQGDAALLAADERFETRRRAASRSTARSCPRATSAGWSRAARSSYADELLGAPFQLRGEVVHGDKRGRELGFPTANIVPDDGYVSPGHGVYAGRGRRRPAPAVNIGVRPDVRDRPGRARRGVPDRLRRGSVRRELRIDFLERLRGERRFESVEDLVEQMRQDVEQTRTGELLAVRSRPATLIRRMTLTRSASRSSSRSSASPGHRQAEVQIALLTERINDLTEHLRDHARTTTRAAGC